MHRTSVPSSPRSPRARVLLAAAAAAVPTRPRRGRDTPPRRPPRPAPRPVWPGSTRSAGSMLTLSNTVRSPKLDTSSPRPPSELRRLRRDATSAVSTRPCRPRQGAGPSPIAGGDAMLKGILDPLKDYRGKLEQTKGVLDKANANDPASVTAAASALQILKSPTAFNVPSTPEVRARPARPRTASSCSSWARRRSRALRPAVADRRRTFWCAVAAAPCRDPARSVRGAGTEAPRHRPGRWLGGPRLRLAARVRYVGDRGPGLRRGDRSRGREADVHRLPGTLITGLPRRPCRTGRCRSPRPSPGSRRAGSGRTATDPARAGPRRPRATVDSADPRDHPRVRGNDAARRVDGARDGGAGRGWPSCRLCQSWSARRTRHRSAGRRARSPQLLRADSRPRPTRRFHSNRCSTVRLVSQLSLFSAEARAAAAGRPRGPAVRARARSCASAPATRPGCRSCSPTPAGPPPSRAACAAVGIAAAGGASPRAAPPPCAPRSAATSSAWPQAWTRGAVKAVPAGMAAGRGRVAGVDARRRPAGRARRLPAGSTRTPRRRTCRWSRRPPGRACRQPGVGRGPALRISGARRVRRLAELVGPAPRRLRRTTGRATGARHARGLTALVTLRVTSRGASAAPDDV